MCEVNVTCLINDVDPFILSHSAAEAGTPNQWSDAISIAADKPLTIDNRKSVKEFFAGFGAWERDEIAAWTDTELDALVLQYAAGDLREAQALCPGDGLADIDWTEAEELSGAGTIGGRLFANGDELFISLSD